jgi:MFS family permease
VSDDKGDGRSHEPRGWRRPFDHRAFRSLRESNYRKFFAGHAISVVGTWMQRVAQDWLVLELTGSPVALGWTLAFQFLPTLAFGLWGGTLADRMDKRKVVMWTQGAQAVLALALGLLAAIGVVELWMVYGLALLLGCVTVLDLPARHGLVSEMVIPESIVNAQSLSSSVHNTGRLVGPAVAGITISLVGISAAFVVNSLSFVPVIIALRSIDPMTLYRGEPMARARGQVREALMYAWRRPRLRVTMALVAVIALLGQNFRVVLPALAIDSLAGGASTYGTLMALLGLGAVVGALITAWLGGTSGGWVTGTGLAFGVASLAAALVPGAWMIFALMVPLGITNTLFNTVARSTLQVDSSASLRGRLASLHAVVFLGSTPFGGPLLGWIVEGWGPRAGLAVAGVSALAAAVAAFAWLRAIDRRGDAG